MGYIQSMFSKGIYIDYPTELLLDGRFSPLERTRTMTNDKSEAMRDFMTVIRQSWTWAKMTGEEQAHCCEAIQFCHDTSLIGTYRQRYDQLYSVYHAYLIGLGYDGMNWRENGEETPSF